MKCGNQAFRPLLLAEGLGELWLFPDFLFSDPFKSDLPFLDGLGCLCLFLCFLPVSSLSSFVNNFPLPLCLALSDWLFLSLLLFSLFTDWLLVITPLPELRADWFFAALVLFSLFTDWLLVITPLPELRADWFPELSEDPSAPSLFADLSVFT